MNIHNSVVVITSAGSHLGQPLALHFLSLGANVILVDNNEAQLNKTLNQCQAYSNNVFHYLLDDDSFESIQPLFSSITQHFPQGVDVLVNLCPNLPNASLIQDGNVDQYCGQMSKLASTMLCFGKLAAKQMLQHHKRGVIVNLSCQNTDYIDSSSYASVISGLTKSWAKELNPFNIRVGGILPCTDIHTGYRNNWARLQDEMIRNTEYIVENDYFNGRVLDAY